MKESNVVKATPIPPLTARQIEKFWARVDASGDCWEWTGARRNGYGTFSTGRATGTKLAHRVVWQLLVETLSTELEVDHRCFNTGCVNPDHLEPVTPAENARRARWSAWRKKASQTRCVNGHPFDAENTWIRRSGGRVCKACLRDRQLQRPTKGPATHCRRGHPWTAENTYLDSRGRQCKTCMRAHKAAWVSKKTCADPDCDRSVVARELCRMHYKRVWKAERKAANA